MNPELKLFIEDLENTFGSELVSVYLYGSAAAGDFIPGKSDYNLLVILKNLDAPELIKSRPAIREWIRLGGSTPVFFTENEIIDAADVFPIEFHEMQKANKLLSGSDILKQVIVSNDNLRHQCEFELRSKLLRLRRRFVQICDSSEAIAALLSESLPSISAIFSGVLTLNGKPVAPVKAERLKQFAQEFNLDYEVFNTILGLHSDKISKVNGLTQTIDLFNKYLREINKVITLVNNFDDRQ
ncbi:MAG TPA: nucleotidyltransferase domain-containing protein [Pyrinomonadaceae bacterium]|nr:nucleotidyltransferase domain-containing protein [Pyrinomonadaceae bacterium]